jgi:hypothetical protein
MVSLDVKVGQEIANNVRRKFGCRGSLSLTTYQQSLFNQYTFLKAIFDSARGVPEPGFWEVDLIDFVLYLRVGKRSSKEAARRNASDEEQFSVRAMFLAKQKGSSSNKVFMHSKQRTEYSKMMYFKQSSLSRKLSELQNQIS